MGKSLYQSLSLSLVLFLILGLGYSLLTTVVASWLFPYSSQGSLISVQGKTIGSELIGQTFKEKKYFHGRPSAAGNGEKASQSAASNLALSNPKLEKQLEMRILKILEENPTLKREDIPNDLVMASGSGLDPHISLQGALIQIPRIAKERQLDEVQLKQLVEKNAHSVFWGISSEKIVSVLSLNLALDNVKP